MSKNLYRLNVVAVTALFGFLSACSMGKAGNADAEERRAARMELLAEQQRQRVAADNPPAVFPAGTKRLVEEDYLGLPGRTCGDGGFALNELTARRISLSNRDVLSAVQLLRTMGYRTLSHGDDDLPPDPATRYSCADLPMLLVPRPHDENSLTINSNAAPGDYPERTGQMGMGSLRFGPLRKTNAVDLDQVIVFFHETQAAEVTRLEELLSRVVDTPSPQVYIETMVLEVSEEDSKELGVAYTTANIGDNSLLSLGALGVGEGDTVGYERNTRRDADGNFEFSPGMGVQARVRALVEEGKAEILARPSVLALSNRQAVIQIVDVIQSPIVESAIGTTGELVVSAYSFEPLLLGITLNLRPRVSADREWVSLEIDATVEAEVDENSGEVFAPDGEGGRVLLAEKKGSAARKVQTFARIPDRTPIVIGGLVAGNKELQKSRVPFFGSIPGVGALFGATDNEIQKREIVIVLTPHVLAEDAIGIRANTANSAVMDRQSDLELFNGVYRVTAGDVYDMNFLLEDKRFASYRVKARDIAEASPELVGYPPIRAFSDDRVPGDEVLVRKMIFDIVAANLGRTEPDPAHLYLPTEEDGVRKLVSLANMTRDLDVREGDEAVRISLRRDEHGEPWFESETVLLADGLPPPSPEVVVLRSERDRQRLVTAISTDLVIRRNGGFAALNVATIREGMLLSLAGHDEFAGYVVSMDTLRIYYDSKYVLRSLRSELEKAYLQIDTLLAAN